MDLRLSVFTWSPIILISVSGCAGGTEPAGVAVPSDVVEANAVVGYVIDGDTIEVVVDGRDERVRLTGIDTPEKERRDTGANAECFANEATDFTEGLLPAGTRVRLERDTVARDDYGRLLAYVYRSEDGIFVNYEIVRQGFALPLTIAPNDTHSQLMADAARDAESDGIGMWEACRGR